MKNSQQKATSLKPSKFNEKDTEPEMIIDRILGPGLTVIGCELTSYRQAFMRQMAIAIITGHKFLNNFAVKKCKVLYNAGGLSEYKIFKNLMDFHTNALDLHKKWWRFDKDCIGQLDSYLDKHRGLGAVFLGEYSLIKRRLGSTWIFPKEGFYNAIQGQEKRKMEGGGQTQTASYRPENIQNKEGGVRLGIHDTKRTEKDQLKQAAARHGLSDLVH